MKDEEKSDDNNDNRGSRRRRRGIVIYNNYIKLHRKNRYQEICWSITKVFAELCNTTSGLRVREQDIIEQGFSPTISFYCNVAAKNR